MTNPLFIPDLATLKSSLRLSSAHSGDSETMVQDALRTARSLFFARLGSTLVSAIKAIVRSDDPLTPDQLKRDAAELCEQAIVRRHLLRTMPQFTLDPTSGQEIWNENGLMRRWTKSEVSSEITRLDSEIEGYLSQLVGTTSSSGLAVAITGEQDTPNPRPGRYDFTVEDT